VAISRKQRASIVTAVAVVSQAAGWFLAQGEGAGNQAGIVLFFGGALLIYVACGLLAKAKGRGAAWALLGILWFLGLAVVALLPDKSGQG